jgi:hypothetical protein
MAEIVANVREDLDELELAHFFAALRTRAPVSAADGGNAEKQPRTNDATVARLRKFCKQRRFEKVIDICGNPKYRLPSWTRRLRTG